MAPRAGELSHLSAEVPPYSELVIGKGGSVIRACYRLPRDTRHYLRWRKPRLGITVPEIGKLAPTRIARPVRRDTAPTSRQARTSLADVLFTSTQQRVLALLFSQASRSFFSSELIQLAGSGSGAVQRELKGATEVDEQLVAAMLRVARKLAMRLGVLLAP